MILGIDEVGRGPWAGPLVMGACILNDNPREEWQASLTDSKKLTPKKREALEPIILSGAAAYGLGWVVASELDKIGMSSALRLACRRAVKAVQKSHIPFHEIIIDGTVNFLADTPLAAYVSTIKKADFLIKEVSAASILAKVARDRYMINLAKEYPDYGFEQHVGYGTKMHRERLNKYGPCPEHRASFRPVAEAIGSAPYIVPRQPQSDASLYNNRSLEHENPSDTKNHASFSHGRHAEKVVSNYLTSHGHKVIGQNYRTRYYEIDVISIKDGVIYFTEVKYRMDSAHGSPLEMIGREKLRQMKFAAEAFVHQKKLPYPPRLAVAGVIGSDYQLKKWFPLGVE